MIFIGEIAFSCVRGQVWGTLLQITVAQICTCCGWELKNSFKYCKSSFPAKFELFPLRKFQPEFLSLICHGTYQEKKLCEIRVNLSQEIVNQRASILCNRPSVLGSRAKLSILDNRKLLFKGEICSTNPVILSQLTFGNWLRIWEKMKLKNPPFWILLSNLANYTRKFSSPP